MQERTAPELPADLDWLPDGRPRQFRTLLRGQVVLVWFWTASAVHSERAAPVLRALEVRFAGRPFAVVGVHSARYPAERSSRHVAAAVERLGIRHPTVNDPDRAVWNVFGVRAWPTIALIDARGVVRFQGAGEPDERRLAPAIDFLCQEAEAEMGARPLPVDVRVSTKPPPARARTELRFPAGVAFDAERDLLWIADTGRHRVVAIDATTRELRLSAGTGQPGRTDGDFGYATFCAPRGLAVLDGRVVVADAGNHVLRRVDPGDASVDTLHAGEALPAPWGVAVTASADLVVALAGGHRLWRVSAGGGTGVEAGTGTPGFVDGDRHSAAFDQPAAVAVRGERIAFADAQNDAVRVLDTATGCVETLVGGGPFRAGDALGAFEATRLQHPCGVAWHGDDLLVADTYNDRVVRLSLARRQAESVLDRAQGLRRPEALCVAGDVLFVADTGNHRVLRFDLTTDVLVPEPLHIVDPHPEHGEPLPVLRACADSSVTLCFPLGVPHGEHSDPEVVPWAVVVPVEGGVPSTAFEGPLERQGEWGVLRDVPTGAPGSGRFELLVRYVTRAEPGGALHVQELGGTFDVTADVGSDLVLEVPLSP